MENHVLKLAINEDLVNLDFELLPAVNSLYIAKVLQEEVNKVGKLKAVIRKVLGIYAQQNWTSKSKGMVKIGETNKSLGEIFNTIKINLTIDGKEIKLNLPKIYKFLMMSDENMMDFLKINKDKNSPSGTKVRYAFMNSSFGNQFDNFKIEFKYAYAKDRQNLTDNTEGANLQAKKILFMARGALASKLNDVNVFVEENDKDEKLRRIILESKNMSVAKDSYKSYQQESMMEKFLNMKK